MFHKKLDDQTELKSVAPGDAWELFALVETNRKRLREWLPWLDLNKNLDDTNGFIERGIKKLADRQGVTVLIWHQGRIAGVADQHAMDRSNRKVCLGYWIAEAYAGKGLVTRAAEVLTDLSFREDKLNRVEIKVATGNKKSCAIAERLGFQLEGVARQSEWLYDHFVDHCVYGMLERDWRKR